jgi:hypothetical protein
MSPRARLLFLALVVVQAAHASEEFAFALWEHLPYIARVISTLLTSHVPTGFALVNGAFVLFGLASYLGPASRGWPSARGIAWVWVAVEIFNGIFHPLLALRAGGYFPGVATAPVLLVLALALARDLRADAAPEAVPSG